MELNVTAWLVPLERLLAVVTVVVAAPKLGELMAPPVANPFNVLGHEMGQFRVKGLQVAAAPVKRHEVLLQA